MLQQIPAKYGVSNDLIDIESYFDSELTYKENKEIILKLIIPLSEKKQETKWGERDMSLEVKKWKNQKWCEYCNEYFDKGIEGHQHLLACKMIHTACRKFDILDKENIIREIFLYAKDVFEPETWKQTKIILGVVLWKVGGVPGTKSARQFKVSKRSLQLYRNKVVNLINKEFKYL